MVTDTLVEDALEDTTSKGSKVVMSEEQVEIADGVTQSIQEIRTLALGRSD